MDRFERVSGVKLSDALKVIEHEGFLLFVALPMDAGNERCHLDLLLACTLWVCMVMKLSIRDFCSSLLKNEKDVIQERSSSMKCLLETRIRSGFWPQVEEAFDKA